MGEIAKAWHNYIINKQAQLGNNSTLYKTHKEGNPIRLLTTGCNTALGNFSRFIEKTCAPLTNNTDSRINDTEHMLQIICNINVNELPNDTILVCFI